MPSSDRHRATTKALREHRRPPGRVKRFPAFIFIRVTAEMHAAAHDAADALGLGLAEYVRLVLSEALGVPNERPNLDNTKEA